MGLSVIHLVSRSDLLERGCRSQGNGTEIPEEEHLAVFHAQPTEGFVARSHMAIFEATHLYCSMFVLGPVPVPVLEQWHGHAFGQPALDVPAARVAERLAGHAGNWTAFPTSDIAGIVGRVAGRECPVGS
jgi:hypothetical protein